MSIYNIPISSTIRRAAGVTALFAVSALFASAPVRAGAPIPNAEIDFDPEISVKVLKEKSRLRASSDGENVTAASGDGSGCGNVVINSQANNGRGNMFGKESVTIVTGDVINTANCK
jgi:hypothetical protein